MFRSLFALSLLAPAASWAGCPASPSDLSSHAAAAEKSFAELDAASFTATMEAMAAELDCLESVIPPGIAAEVHKSHGLAAFLARDLEGAQASFRSAAAIDENLVLDPSYAPEGGPLHSAWAAASELGPSPTEPMPQEGWIDGMRSSERPRDTPHILQTENGDTYRGAWLAAGEELPEWAASSAAVVGEPDPVGHGAQDKKEGVSATTLQLASASGAALVLSGGLFAAALAQQGKFKNDDTLTYSDRADLQKRTNNLGFAAQGIGVVGLGLGATAVISTRW
jgi:hypothetical protein